jgi:phospholipid/cholesterol/gamma-HCH transport system substrate-binding protein
MLSFETYTASLKSKGEAIDSILAQADDAFAGFDSTMAKIGGVLPGLSDGKTEELFEKLKSLRELADTYKQKSVTFMEEGRRMLSDVSEGANNFARKIDPQSAPAAGPRRPPPKRQ